MSFNLDRYQIGQLTNDDLFDTYPQASTTKMIGGPSHAYSPARYLRYCCFIAVVRKRLKVPAKNFPALLFLSKGKEEERKKTIQVLFPC